MHPFRFNDIPADQRADVEKHRISETEETKRVAARDAAETRRKGRQEEGYYLVRALICLVPLFGFLTWQIRACDVAETHEKTEQIRLQTAAMVDGGR